MNYFNKATAAGLTKVAVQSSADTIVVIIVTFVKPETVMWGLENKVTIDKPKHLK